MPTDKTTQRPTGQVQEIKKTALKRIREFQDSETNNKPRVYSIILATLIIGTAILLLSWQAFSYALSNFTKDSHTASPPTPAAEAVVPPENWFKRDHVRQYIESRGYPCTEILRGDLMDSCILDGDARRIAFATGDDALPARLLPMIDSEPDSFLVFPEDSSSWTILCIAFYEKGVDAAYETCSDLASGIPDAQLENALKEDKLFTRNEDGELMTLSGTPVEVI